MSVTVAAFDVSLFKNDSNQWKDIGGEQAPCKTLLRRNDADRLVLIFKQTGPESKMLYQATITKDTTIKKTRDDFIQAQISDGVLFGMKFKEPTDPDKFMAYLRDSDAHVEDKAVGYSVDPNAARPAATAAATAAARQQEFATVQPRRGIQDNPDFHQRQHQQLNMPQQMGRPAPGPDFRQQHEWPQQQHQQQYTGGGNHSGNQPYQLGTITRHDSGSSGSGHHGYNKQQSRGGSSSHWSGSQTISPGTTPPYKGTMPPWPENDRHVPEEQAPVPKQPKIVLKTREELERYAQHLEAALIEGDVDYAKTVVKLLVEARNQQLNFSIKFADSSQSPAKNYFRLKLTIEREITLNEPGILFFLHVTEDYTIGHLQEVIELRFSINPEQQHWIIGSQFATDKDKTLKDYGLKGRGAEAHLFISKGDLPPNNDQVTENGSYQQHQPRNHQARDCYPQSDRHQHNQYYGQPPPQQSSQWQNQDYDQYRGHDQGMNQPMMRHAPTNMGYNRNIPEQYEHNGRGGGMPPYRGGQPMSFTNEAVRVEPPPPPRPRPPTPPPPGWKCTFCGAQNVPYRPGCSLCSSARPEDYKPPPDYKPTKEEEKWLQDDEKGILGLEEFERSQKEEQVRQAQENYAAMMAMAEKNLVPNEEQFECPICYIPIDAGQGVKLRECLHHCCKDCLHDHIMASNDADVQCPCNEEFACGGSITELEMRALLTDEELEKVHSRGLNLAEGQSRSYHCKTPDCKGWCIYEDDVNEFNCMVCDKKNCLLCKAIHTPMTCKEYQEDLKIKAANDKAAQETKKMIEDMVTNGEAMYCPNQNCGLIIQKKNGCDWIRCSCKTEICWVTKGARWGPKGKGDTSGGCRCRVNGKKCHPNCGNCH